MARRSKHFSFSARSFDRMEGVLPELKRCAIRALELSPVDFGIPKLGGIRDYEEQRKLFEQKRSQCDGRFKISPHQVGYALDFYAIVNGKPSWEHPYLAAIAAAFLQAANEQDLKLEWGGFWHKNKRPDMKGHYWGWDCGHVQVAGVNYGEIYTRPSDTQADSGRGVLPEQSE